jgi:hypothetical protein
MACESHLKTQIESAVHALLAMETGNRRVDRHPFPNPWPGFDHPTEFMTWDHALSWNCGVAYCTLLEPMGIGSTQTNAEHSDQNLTDRGNRDRGLDLLEPAHVDKSNRCCVLDGHPGVITASPG